MTYHGLAKFQGNRSTRRYQSRRSQTFVLSLLLATRGSMANFITVVNRQRVAASFGSRLGHEMVSCAAAHATLCARHVYRAEVSLRRY